MAQFALNSHTTIQGETAFYIPTGDHGNEKRNSLPPSSQNFRRRNRRHSMEEEEGLLESIKVGINFTYDPDAPLPEDLHALKQEFEPLDETMRTKHMYACAGLALYAAQCLEVNLRHLLILERKARGELLTLQELDDFDDHLSKKTQGNLLRRVQERVGIDEEGINLLEEALAARNTLAHRFFYDHASDCVSERGQREVVGILLGYINLFRLAEGLTECVNTALLKIVGVSEEHIDDLYKQMLDEARGTQSTLDEDVAGPSEG